MPENEKKETTARRFSSYNVKTGAWEEFDCQPPPEAMDELLRPKRAHTFRPPPNAGTGKLEKAQKFVNTLFFWMLALAFVLTLCAIASWQGEKRAAKKADQAILRTVAPTPVSTPRPTPPPALTPPPTQTYAPKAKLVRLPESPRRAEYVGLPIGWQGNEQMPDGRITPVRYMGEVGYFDNLPRNPNFGDMWKVTSSGNSWVWYTPAGFSRPAWVDP